MRLYCFNEDYDNEIRICDSAIENLFGDNKIKDYIIRKEDAINRKNNKVKLNIDEELYNLILKEKRFFLSSSLDHEYYQTNDLTASVNSGSFKFDSLVIIPCSMKTLSAIANGYASN